MEWQWWHWMFLICLFVLIISLAWLPGRIAKRRGHANATAIRVCGVIGLIIWPCWIVALIWAYTGPDHSKAHKETEPSYHYGTAEGIGKPQAPPSMPGQSRQERWAKKVVRY